MDDPSTYSEPMEDSVDWAHLRWMRTQREEQATLDERRRGIPPLEENQKRVVRDMAVEARKGRDSYPKLDPDWLAERRRRIEETGE